MVCKETFSNRPSYLDYITWEQFLEYLTITTL